MKNFIPVENQKCELEGPFECPSCGGHSMFDSTFLEQVSAKVACPHCLVKLEVPEHDALKGMPVREKIQTANGSISIKENRDPDYPGYYVSVNDEPLVLVEYDAHDNEYAIRVWSHKAPEHNYAYKQSIPVDFMKEDELNEERTGSDQIPHRV